MQKNNVITKRKILLLTFTLMLIFSLATITFSWYRNYVEVIGPEMTTGHINVNMNTYYVNNFEIKDEKNRTIDSSTIGNITLDSNIETFTPDGNIHMYYFFHNPGTTNSIDLEVMLAMNIEGLYTNYEVDKIGSVNVTLDNETADFKDWITQKYTNDPVLTAERFEQFITDSTVSHNGGDTRNFLELDKAIISGAVKKEDVLCIRVTVTLNDAITISHLNKSYPVRMSLCIAQDGGLPGQEKITTYYASTLSSLNAALNLYKPNDKIIITSNIDYVGDLIFNRPVNVVIQESTLNVHGNLIFSYSYPGSFSLNTAQSGRVCVYRINNAGGDFEVDLPQANIELIGKNSSLSGQADIYVQRNVKLNADENVGVIFTSSRICETTGVDIYSNTLKDISIGDHTRVEVGSRTEIGNLFSEVDSVIRVRNNGTINTINLQLMSIDTTYVTSPNIFIDNYSVINNILLPEWSTKFVTTINDETGEDSYRGNTRIVSNTGASSMNIQCTGSFKSDGSKNPEFDDVEYVRMNQFVEVVNGNKSDVIVHYTITEIEELVAAGTDNTLKGIINYYSSHAGGSIINSPSEITKLKVICYSGSFMSSADYTFIKTMSQLSYLDLSDAVSTSYTTPNSAFENMISLTHVDMSEVDTTWGTHIFRNSSVEEIKIPSSVTTLPRYAFTGLKYIHTNFVVVSTNSYFINDVKSAKQYLFTPDKSTHDAYVAAGYIDEMTYLEATRYSGQYGEYFFRINKDNLTFELATIVGDSFDLSLLKSYDYKFDFDTITLDGIQYKITSIDDYAFKGKTFTNSNGNGDFVFGDKLTYIGQNAFREAKGFETIVFHGETYIEGYAFYALRTVKSIKADLVPYIGTYAFSSPGPLLYFYAPAITDCGNYFLSSATALKVVELGMIADGSKVYFSGGKCDTLILHTDNTPDPSTYITKINLGLDFSTIIVNEKYKELWDNSYYNANVNSNRTEDILPIAGNPKDNLIYVGNEVYPDYIYYKNEKDELTLIRSLLSEINGGGNDYVVPTISKTDHSLIFENDNINAYPLVEIGDTAYKYTNIYNVSTLTFLNTVKKIGVSAFKGVGNPRPGLAKEYGYLNLNNVEEVKTLAFKGNLVSQVTAPELITCEIDAFVDCSSTVIAIMPKIKNTTGAFFKNHTSLKFIILGPLDGSSSGVIHDTLNISMIFVNNSEAVTTSNPKMYNVGTTNYWLKTSDRPVIFIGKSTPTTTDVVINSLDNLYFADFYQETVTINNVNYTFELPTYIFYDNGNEISLVSKMTDILEENFVLASEIFQTGNNINFLGENRIEFTTVKPANYDENSEKFVASKISNYALKYTTVNSNCNFKLGDNYTEVGESALAALAAKSVDLNNVTLLGRYGLNGAKMFELKCDKVTKVDYHSLTSLANLDVINLPSVTYIEEYGFRYSAMSRVIIGDKLVTMRRHIFEGNKNLDTIYILSKLYDKKTSVDYIYESSIPNINNLLLYVPSSMVTYFRDDTYSKDILDSNIYGFEESYTEEETGLVYLWSKIQGNEAQIESVVGLTENTGISQLVIPSTIIETIITEVADGETTTQVIEEIPYNVTRINDTFFNDLKNAIYIVGLELPNNLEVFNGDNSLLTGSGIASISISSENNKFETLDGVLYSKGKKVLMLYPIAKQSTSFVAPNEVEMIYQYAFMGNKYLQNVSFPNNVTLLDGAFKECTSLQTVTFENIIPSTFVGKGIFTSNGSGFVIYVPTGTRNDYISNIIFDLDIIDIIQENTQQ